MARALASVLLLAALAATQAAGSSAGAPPPAEPAQYVPASECAGCHEAEQIAWRGSHHDRSMEVANDATVLGDFEGATFEGSGLSARFSHDASGYWIDTHSGAGPLERWRVRYTFGVSPLQQYLIELPGGRLQAFTVAWDTERRVWFHLRPDAFDRPGDPLHFTGLYQSWNAMCAECHSTGVRKGYDAATDTYATSFEDVDVGCQSCHGPGSRHVAWARGGRPPDPGRGLTVDVRGSAEAAVETCAPCHSRRSRVADHPTAGEPFTDSYRPETLHEGLYFADGQIQNEVFEYGSFLQSRMHARGVRCTDCHDAHSQRPMIRGNDLCLRCHGPVAPARFPSLDARRADFDSPAHHHHEPGSEGARCVSCHMPERTYMRVDARRDHSLRVPRPDLSVTLGTPNACTQGCHADRTDAWAAAAVQAWSPGPRPSHYGEIFARARAGEDVRRSLAALARDPGQPAIVRATALEHLQAAPDACTAIGAALRADPSPLLRATATACGEGLAPANRARWAAPGLGDPSRLVRIEAARILAGETAPLLAGASRARFASARAELEARHRAELDQPDGSFHLALLDAGEGRAPLAKQRYARALALDPAFLPAAFNLAMLDDALGDPRAALGVLGDALVLHPESGETHYALGLLRVQLGDLDAAESDLDEAERLLPHREDVRANHRRVRERIERRP